MSDIGPITFGAGGGGAGNPEQHVWLPPTQVAIVDTPSRLVRIWDRNWNFVLRLPSNSVTGDAEIFTATLPLDHELPKWILADGAGPKRCRLTVDDDAVRWSGVLDQYKVLKVSRDGGCPECKHCEQRVMEIHWTQPPSAVASMGPFVVTGR